MAFIFSPEDKHGGVVELNPLVLVGGAVAAVAAYAFSEKKKTEDTLVAQALPVAAQQVQMGVPIQQAAINAATNAIVNTAAKNAVPVAVQLIKTGTPVPSAIAQAINAEGNKWVDPRTVPTASRTLVSWDVTWTETRLLDKTRGYQTINQKAGYDTEAAAMAKANELRAFPPGGLRWFSNIKVEKTTEVLGPQQYARKE
jgi:hypothetical protein